jgi:hypothetical protein
MAGVRPKWRVGRMAVLATLAGMAIGAAGLFSIQLGASADTTLSSVVLPTTLPGMVAAPQGDGNGPITAANVSQLGVSAAASSTVQNQLDDGALSGYYRTWSRNPPNGDAIAIGVLRFAQPRAAAAFVAGANNSLRGQPGVLVSSVPGIPGASVYTVASLTSGSAQVTFFDHGNDAVWVTLRSSSYDVTSSDAATLADRQLERIAGSASVLATNNGWFASSSLAYRVGEIFGALAVVALLIWVVSSWLRPRRRGGVTVVGGSARHASSTAAGAYPPPPLVAPEPGWVPNPQHRSEQLYWNGHEWAGRRHWKAGQGWVEQVPAHAH